jgi:hypothetical protein
VGERAGADVRILVLHSWTLFPVVLIALFSGLQFSIWNTQ